MDTVCTTKSSFGSIIKYSLERGFLEFRSWQVVIQSLKNIKYFHNFFCRFQRRRCYFHSEIFNQLHWGNIWLVITWTEISSLLVFFRFLRKQTGYHEFFCWKTRKICCLRKQKKSELPAYFSSQPIIFLSVSRFLLKEQQICSGIITLFIFIFMLCKPMENCCGGDQILVRLQKCEISVE
jgi:hypothetical protein